MKKLREVALLSIISSLLFLGVIKFGNELKKDAEIKSHREEIRFKKDSLQLEINKKIINKTRLQG
jgi:hypothetical protein